MSDAKARICAHAKGLGFDLVGVTGAQPFAATQRVFEERVAAGYLSQWRYPRETLRRVCTATDVLSNARSIICTASAYVSAAKPYDPYAPGLRGAVSRHAWGRDYHRVIGNRLRALARFIEAEYPGSECVPCVDTGPMVDRAAAVRAGIGWFGKNGNVLTKEFGSWVLLGELITTLDLEPDEPVKTNCGTCEVCVHQCPTGAIGPDGAV